MPAPFPYECCLRVSSQTLIGEIQGELLSPPDIKRKSSYDNGADLTRKLFSIQRPYYSIMQNIEVSNEAYQKFMRYCKETGQNASVAIGRAAKALRELDAIEQETKCIPSKAQLALLEEDYAKAVRDTKKPVSHEEVFRRVL